MSFGQEFKELCEKYDVQFGVISAINQVAFHASGVRGIEYVYLNGSPEEEFLGSAAERLTDTKGAKIV